MRESEVRRRQDQIGQRVQELRSLRARQRTLREHTNSGYFLDGLLGHHPYLDQARSRADYLERYASFADPIEDKVADLIAEAQDLPVVSGQRWDTRRNLRIGIIADRFLFDSLKDAAHFVPIDPDGDEEQMEGLDLLLITSAWRGLADEWFNVALSGSPARQALETRIVPWARERDIPIAFYSKEDPPNYSRFAALATLADHVFTSAVECVAKYEAHLGPDVPVSVLPFAVNFIHHNPLGSMRHQGREFAFAGSWLEHKYPERRSAALRIFDGLLKAGADLTIVDRNLELDEERFANPERYLFPERYLPHLHRPLDHEVLLSLQRLLPVSINLNSVTASQSMFANRVIELQAMGTFVVSNYNAGMNSLHPQVCIPDSVLDMKQTYESLTQASIRQAQVAGIRHAFTDNTAFDRVDAIAEAMGLSVDSPEHTVFVAGLTEPEFTEFRLSQTYAGPLLNADSGERVASAGGDVVLSLDARVSVGPHLVQDAVNAFRYSDADEVLVRPIDTSAELFEFVESTAPREEAVNRTSSFGADDPEVGAEPSRQVRARWADEGTRLGEDQGKPETTLTIASDLTAAGRESITVVSDPEVDSAPEAEPEPEISVIVPVYNNGAHLKFKCFESLRRSSIFDRAEVLLIDDGSTDLETVAILDELDRAYPNVRVHRFPAGGSGSASRPRNKGLELTRTPYVTYLDPDNEQTNDGFAELLALVRDNEYQFAIGDMVRFKDKRMTVKNAAMLRPVVGEDGRLVENALSRVRFQPMSIQALVADARWLKSLRIYQPIGAVGQDSYFFQQMLFHATRIGLTDTAIHTYYAAVSNSTVNTIGPRFYEKYLPLEEDRASWLRDVGMLEDYNAKRLEPFVKGWFVKKLEFVAAEDQEACRALIRRLTRYYGKSAWEDPELASFHAVMHD